MSKDAGTSRGPKGPFRMSKDAGPSRGPKGPFTMRTRSKTAPAGTVRKHFSGKFARKGRLSNIERATPGGAVRKHFSQRMSNIERDDGGNIVHRRRVSPAAMPRTDSETGRKRSSASDSTDSSQTGLSQMAAPTPKRRRTNRSVADGQVTEADNFCWLCHREGRVICCELCPRVFHTKCLGIEAEPMGTWVCPECQKIMRAECVDTCSKAMSMITCDQLCVLLKYAVQRMKHQGSEPFQKPVDMASLPTYRDYIVHPVDLGLIEKNIRRKVYGSTEALLAEVKWILHNCIIFNGLHHKLTTSAKMVVKICRHEMTEIEICPDCYTNSCTKRNDNWFCVPCRTPHTLVWAKMKGYPFWPAKALREVDGQVDVRFFGEHDRAWVPMNQVYLLSRIPPVEMKNTRGGYRQSMDEVQRHISRLKEKFGSFHYASYRTSYNQKKPRAAGTLAIKDEFGGKQISETKSTVDRIIAMDTTVPSGSSVVGKNTHAKGSVKRGSELSIVSKTASAVKSKYNSIITTRRAKEMAAGSDSGSVQVQAVRTGSLQGKGRLNRAEVSESCGSGFEMSDVSILHSEVTRFRPLVTLTRISPDMLQPLSGQSTVRKIEDTIKKRDALKADADRETGADHLEDESSTEQMEQAPVTDAKQSSGQKDESGTEQMEQEQPAVNEAKEQPTVAAVAATDIVSLKVCGVDESTGGENAASATPCETDSNTASYKKNKFLESLVETCKAKLGVNADEPSSGAGDATSSGSSSSSSDSSHSSEGSDSHCEKEAGEKEAGEKKAGEKEAGEKEAGEKEAGEKEAQEKKAGEKEAGEKEAGEKEAGEKKAGEKEAREKKAGEKEAGEKGEPKESDKENANKDGHTTSVDATSNNVGINNTATDAPAKVCNKKKDAESECIITSSVEAADNKPHEIGSKKTIESDDEKAAVTPSVDKVKHDTMNNQPSAKCDGSKSKTNEINENKNLKLMKPDSPGLEMEVDSISDSESESNVSHVVIDIDKEPGCHGKEMTINVDRSANDDNAFVIDLDKDDDQKHDVKASAAPIGGAGACGTIPEVQRVKECVITVTNKSGLMGSKKPVKFKSERQKEIERQQRHMMSMVKSSHSATLTPLSTNHLPAVKLSSSFPEVGVGLPTQPHIIPDDDIDDVDGILDDVMSEKRLKESVEKMDVSKYSDRLMMSVRSTLQDMYYDLVNTEATKAVKRTFQLELDKIMWQHRQQLAELKHNANLTLAEMRASLECDKQKVVKDLRQKLEAEKIIAINDTKKKQWCAYCSKEANFYCCWNTSYCDYPCQQAAWPEHMSKCTQTRTGAPQAETSSGGISMAGAETKPELARHTNIGQRQADELHKDHQMALSYTFGGTQNAAGGMNSAGPFASTLQPPTNLQNVQQPLQSVAQMPLQLRYPGTAPHFQQQYAPIAPGQMVGHGGMPGQSGGPMLYSAVLRQPPSHTAGHMAGMTMGQNPGQLMMAPGTNLHRGPMSYRPPQGY